MSGIEDAIAALDSLSSDAQTIADGAERVATNAARMVLDAGAYGDVFAVQDSAERIASQAAGIAADAGPLAAQLVDIVGGLGAAVEDLDAEYREELPAMVAELVGAPHVARW